MAISEDEGKTYGTDKFGRLRRAMLHRPDRAIELINDDNMEFFLFDKVPNADRYLEEHSRYKSLLETHGVEVLMLSDYVTRNADLADRLPNLAYMHDIAAISSYGSIISKMSSRGRCHEEIVIREALSNLGIPNLYEPPEGDAFEGCLLFSPSTLFVADTERHGKKSIERFINAMLDRFDEVIYALIPEERRYMHPDMVINRVTDCLMVYYPPAFLKTYLVRKDIRKEIDIKSFMNARGISMVPLSDKEQQRWGSSFVPLEPGALFLYDISLEQGTVNTLESEGVRLITFHPEALLAGGGSLRCLTMRIFRH